MATLTIRNLDEDTMTSLRACAARKGTSVEQESLAILQEAMRHFEPPADGNLDKAIRDFVEPYGGFDLMIPPRSGPRASVPKHRGPSILRELEVLGIRPEQPFEQKALSDEMWDESES
jgi:antitoxin FitA